MHKVVTINLNGKAYQLDEPAFGLLRAYLDQAEACLKDNLDQAEILADLEQAIAEKCRRFLNPNKTVVSAAEMAQVVKEMGPVEAADSQPAGAGAPAPAAGIPEAERSGPKRFYRIRDGAMFAGICNGAAAYLHVDVLFVRIAVVVLTVVSHGWALLGYWMLAFLVPEADTADEHAAAHGQAPFNAQDVIDEAKRAAASFTASTSSTRQEWRRQILAQRRRWRSKARAWRRQWRATTDSRYWAPGMSGPALYRSPAGTGFLRPVFGLVSLACFVLLILVILSLSRAEAFHAWPLWAGMPMWAGILLCIVLLHIVTWPMRAARYASRYPWGYHDGWFAMWEGLFATAVMVFGLWLLFRHLPPIHDLRDFTQGLPEAFRGAAHELAGWFRQIVEALRSDT